MTRPREFVLEVTAMIDADEIDTKEKMEAKKKQIRATIEDIDPAVGIFSVESIVA